MHWHVLHITAIHANTSYIHKNLHLSNHSGLFNNDSFYYPLLFQLNSANQTSVSRQSLVVLLCFFYHRRC
jgi:hypothetical protein